MSPMDWLSYFVVTGSSPRNKCLLVLGTPDSLKLRLPPDWHLFTVSWTTVGISNQKQIKSEDGLLQNKSLPMQKNTFNCWYHSCFYIWRVAYESLKFYLSPLWECRKSKVFTPDMNPEKRMSTKTVCWLLGAELEKLFCFYHTKKNPSA